MDRIAVMELVRSFQVGELRQKEFLSRATAALGSASLANLLAEASLSSPAKNPPPVVEAHAPPATGGEAGSVEAADVTYPDGQGGTLNGYLAQQPGGGPRPGVVVIQEWWGLNDHIRDVTRRLANEGFVALAPDLYHGVVVSEPDEARKLVMDLDMEDAVAEIRQAIAFLLGRQDVAGPGVGLVGFCMGGRLALQTVQVEPRVSATVSFYGTPLAAEEAARAKAPILGLYGTEDASNPLDRVRAMARALDRAGIENEIQIYQGAHHAFFNDTRASYHPQAAADAWRRTLAWFRRHLG